MDGFFTFASAIGSYATIVIPCVVALAVVECFFTRTREGA